MKKKELDTSWILASRQPHKVTQNEVKEKQQQQVQEEEEEAEHSSWPKRDEAWVKECDSSS